jgi:hypothetical protein
MDTSSQEPLASFRQHMYQLFTQRRDALFDLTDALLTTGPTPYPAYLSLATSFQRGWGSVYDALADGPIDGQAVERLLAQHPLETGEPIYVVDASVWTHCDAEASSEWAFYYHPFRHSAGQLIVVGNANLGNDFILPVMRIQGSQERFWERLKFTLISSI